MQSPKTQKTKSKSYAMRFSKTSLQNLSHIHGKKQGKIELYGIFLHLKKNKQIMHFQPDL